MLLGSDTPLQSLPTSRATLSKPGDIAYNWYTGISVVSVWNIKKLYTQFMYQHISFQHMSLTEAGF